MVVLYIQKYSKNVFRNKIRVSVQSKYYSIKIILFAYTNIIPAVSVNVPAIIHVQPSTMSYGKVTRSCVGKLPEQLLHKHYTVYAKMISAIMKLCACVKGA